MCGNRMTLSWCGIALVACGAVAGVATPVHAQYHTQNRGPAPQSEYETSGGVSNYERPTSAPSRSLYAKQGQFAARTTNYAPVWRVHPNVRRPRPESRDDVRLARYQQDVLVPPFDNEESAAPPFEETESAPPTVEQVPAQQPAAAPETDNQPARTAPSETERRGPTLAPPPAPNEIDSGVEPYEELPSPRGMRRVQPDFDYQVTEEYAPEFDEYGGEYIEEGTSCCPDCGQIWDYCECCPPHVCDDTWPCWHFRRMWGNFRLFCGGWDIGCPWNWWDELSFNFGPHAFKGPLDQGRNGNFGFQAGVNWGGPLWHCHGIGYQLGAQGVSSNFSGNSVEGQSDDSRNQSFLTAGIFTRAPGRGWQLGVAFDWLEDDFYVDVSLNQLRAELSYVTFCGSEIGGWVATSSETDDDEITGLMYEATDMFAFFYRHTMPSGGEGRFWGGGTGDSDGMVGADFRVPLNNRWSLSGAVNYIIPQDGAGEEGIKEEAWGLTMNLVWHPFRPRAGHPGNNGPYRPLFNVADNTTFMVDRELGANGEIMRIQ